MNWYKKAQKDNSYTESDIELASDNELYFIAEELGIFAPKHRFEPSLLRKMVHKILGHRDPYGVEEMAVKEQIANEFFAASAPKWYQDLNSEDQMWVQNYQSLLSDDTVEEISKQEAIKQLAKYQKKGEKKQKFVGEVESATEKTATISKKQQIEQQTMEKNWYKQLKFAQEERKVNLTGKKMYLGKYPKITFTVDPEVPYSLIKYLIQDVRRDISNRVNEGERWLLKVMSAMKKRYGSGDITWLMFNKFKDGTFWVDPYYAGLVSDKFLDLGYNSVGLGALENKGTEMGSLILDGNINSEGIIIQITGYLPSYLKRQIKNLKFWGEKIGNKFYWNRRTSNIKEQLVILEQLFNIDEFNSQALQNNANSYYSDLFSKMKLLELLKLKNELYVSGGFISEVIIPLIDKYVSINTETGEIVRSQENELV